MMVTHILLQTSHGGTNSASKPGMVACTLSFVADNTDGIYCL